MRWIFYASVILSFSLLGNKASASTLPFCMEEKSLDALSVGKPRIPSRVVFEANAVELCDSHSVPRKASVDYLYKKHAQIHNCNALGFPSSFSDHGFIIGWDLKGTRQERRPSSNLGTYQQRSNSTKQWIRSLKK